MNEIDSTDLRPFGVVGAKMAADQHIAGCPVCKAAATDSNLRDQALFDRFCTQGRYLVATAFHMEDNQ